MDICEGYNSRDMNGFVKGFNGTDLLLKDETVVIAVYGSRVTDTFDIKINVAEERTLSNFNSKCQSEIYTYDEIFNEIRSHSLLDDIQLFRDVNFQQLIPSASNFDSSQTIYAQVKDANGKLKYIYTIPLRFKANYNFFFNSVDYETCGNEFVLNFEQLIRDNVTDSRSVSNFQIEYIELEGRRYTDGQIVVMSEHLNRFNGKVKYIGNEFCPNSADFSFTVRDVKYITDRNPIIETCASEFMIDKLNLRILTQVVNDEDYDLKFYLPNGIEIFDGNTVNLTEEELVLSYIPVHYSTGCLGTRGTITIQKTPEIPIRNAELSICLVDLTQEIINQKLTEIKNGVTGGFTYYFNGNQIQENQILSTIQNTLNGIIEVKVGDGCSVTKEFRFNLLRSSIRIANSIKTEELFCLLPTDVADFNAQQLKEIALSNILNSTNLSAYTFRFLDENGNEITSLSDVQDGRHVEVFVKLNSESCWQSFSILFHRINRLVIPNSSRIITANCDDTIILTSTLLTELFGSQVLNYHTNLALNSSISIDFRNGNEVSLSIDFFINENCVTTKEIVVRKGTALTVDVSAIQQEILNNPFRFCDSVNVQELSVYLQSYINQIIAQYPNLRTEESLNFYTDQMTRNNGSVDVIFIDPNSCGRLSVRFNYRPNPSPVLNLVDEVFTCTGIKYQLNLSAYLNPKIINENGQEVIGINSIFQLDLGRYIVSVYNEYGCIVSKILDVSSSPLPIIQEIVLNTETITVLAIGNGGVLEYSLDGRNWQSVNKFYGIQKGVSYTVYVRENGCAIQSVADVVYLNLPNFVSPNGDGINDIWKPIGAKSTLNVRIQIFDRYGKVVYTAEGKDALNWKGKINSRPLPSDSYWYFIEYIDDSTLIKLKYQGYITIKTH